MIENFKLLVVFVSFVGTLLCGLWVGMSWMEARAFERVTGKHVSVWDAMWIELRVQEGAK